MTFLRKQLDEAYGKALNYLDPFISDRNIMKQTSRFDISMHPDRFNIRAYLESSLKRFRHVAEFTDIPDENEAKNTSWLEMGCLFPAFPIALSIIGFKVSLVEDYSFYPDEFHILFKQAEDSFGIKFYNIPFSTQDASWPDELTDRFDYVSCLAVLEHLPYTPRYVLNNIAKAVRDDGKFFCEVPNFHYWNNILKLIGNKHIQQPMEIIYHSEVPFVGHHREYTIEDLQYVLNESGFRTTRINHFNYSFPLPFSWREYLRYSPAFLFNRFKEVILCECRKNT